MDKLFLPIILIYFFISTIRVFEKMNTEQFDIKKHIIIPFLIIVYSLMTWLYFIT